MERLQFRDGGSPENLAVPGSSVLAAAVMRFVWSRREAQRGLAIPRQVSSRLTAWLKGTLPRSHTILKVLEPLSPTDVELAEMISAAATAYCFRNVGPQATTLSDQVELALHSYFALTHPHQVSSATYARLVNVWDKARIIARANLLEDADSAAFVVPLRVPRIELVTDWKRIVKAIASKEQTLHDLSWKRFEDLVAHLLDRFGWEVTPMGYTKDDGIDIIALRKIEPGVNVRMLVQCKRHSADRPVGVSVVRELWTVKWEGGFHQAMLATTSRFTAGAKNKGSLWNLELKDHDNIVQWCGETAGMSRIIL